MDVTDFIQQTYLFATGKAVAPAVGTKNYVKILSLGNAFQKVWAREEGIDWNSLRGVFDIGTVSATDTFDISSIPKLSNQEDDYVVITRTDGKQSKWTIVPINKLQSTSTGNADGICAKSGTDLIFKTAFASTSPDVGGTITVPGYNDPDQLVNPTDEVQVDDPYWLCFICAAEFVRNDITKQNQYGNLVANAINSMGGMKERNRSQREEVDTSEWSPLGQSW